MNSQENPQNDNSPLDLEEISKIDSSQLPPLQRHHIRVLAHCLATFQSMRKDPSDNQIPDKLTQIKWCESNSLIQKDEDFINILIDQFASAAVYLEKISSKLEILPLELSLEDLINDAIEKFRDGS